MTKPSCDRQSRPMLLPHASGSMKAHNLACKWLWYVTPYIGGAVIAPCVSLPVWGLLRTL